MHASAWARIVLDELELDLSTPARHLVETLAHIANETGEAWPSLERLTRRMGRSRTIVAAARAELVAAGLLHASGANRGGRRRSDGSGITARYRLALPVTPAGFAVHNRPAGRTVDDVDAVHNRPEIDHEPSGPPDAKSHEVPLVVTNSYAVPRGAPLTVSVSVDHVPPGADWDDYYAPVGMNGGAAHVR